MDIIGFDDLVRVGEEVDRANRTRRFYYKAQKKQERCDLCGAPREGKVFRHGTRSHNYRDIPILNDRILLVVEMQGFVCRGCNEPRKNRTFVQRIEGLDRERSMTTRCLEWIRTSCLDYTFRDIANACGCPERTVRDIAYEYIAEKNRTYKPYMPEWLGIDEIKLDGKIDSFVCVLVDAAQRRPIDVLPNRKLDTVKKWMGTFEKGRQPRGVSMDMYENYRTAVTEAFPGVPIVIDRFHVVRGANKAVDRVRIRISRKYTEVKKTEEWKDNAGFLRKRWGKIPRDIRPRFLKWLSSWPDLLEVYIRKENFCDIYQFEQKEAARSAIEEWDVSLPDKLRRPFKEVVTAITKWREELLTFFDERVTNAYTEGFNSVIRNVNNQGRGYTFEVLKGKLLFGALAPSKTFRIERAKNEDIKYFRHAYRINCLLRKFEIYPSARDRPGHPNLVPKICMECRRAYDEEDSTQVFIEKYLPAESSIVCNSCLRPIDQEWTNNRNAILPLEKANSQLLEEALKRKDLRTFGSMLGNQCESCDRFFDRDQLNLVPTGSPGEFRILCNVCQDHPEQIESEPFVSNDDFPASSEGSKSTNWSAEAAAARLDFENPDYGTLYRNLEKSRWAEGNESGSRKTKRALGYPIIAKDLKLVFQGRAPSDPAGRPKKRRNKDEDVQLSLDLVFEDLKMKFKRPRINRKTVTPDLAVVL